MIEGKAVYDAEIVELKERFKARGVVLIVIQGNKNKADIEFGSALVAGDIPKSIGVLRAVANSFEQDFMELQRDYHRKKSVN